MVTFSNENKEIIEEITRHKTEQKQSFIAGKRKVIKTIHKPETKHIHHEEESKEKPTSLSVHYVSISYVNLNNSYIQNFRLDRQDFTNNVPSQRIDSFPVSGNRGLYGWTFRHEGKIHRREDLIGTYMGLVTDIHENIHTPDERETRYIVDWMLEPFMQMRSKYMPKPPEYIR